MPDSGNNLKLNTADPEIETDQLEAMKKLQVVN